MSDSQLLTSSSPVCLTEGIRYKLTCLRSGASARCFLMCVQQMAGRRANNSLNTHIEQTELHAAAVSMSRRDLRFSTEIHRQGK